ncbi:MAG: hypothetical protein R3F36_04635 [Candidatus Competibacteraceae bacterium]
MRPLVVWRFSDGKAGHDNQSGGLTEALARLRPVEIVTPQRLTPIAALLALAGGRLTAWPDLPVPDLLVGAGPGTHLSLLAAQRHCAGGGADAAQSAAGSVRPVSDPRRHDTPPVRVNVLATRSVEPYPTLLQPGVPAGPLLIGGPSTHLVGMMSVRSPDRRRAGRRSDDALDAPTTSRRTPASFLAPVTIRRMP